jgi:hypothetical protein
MPLFGDATGFVCSQREYRPINNHLQCDPGGSENPVAAYPTVVGYGRMNGRSGNVTGVTKGPELANRAPMRAREGPLGGSHRPRGGGMTSFAPAVGIQVPWMALVAGRHRVVVTGGWPIAAPCPWKVARIR